MKNSRIMQAKNGIKISRKKYSFVKWLKCK